MDQHAFLARWRVVDKPGFLKLEPSLWIEVVEFVFHQEIGNQGVGVREGMGEGVGEA